MLDQNNGSLVNCRMVGICKIKVKFKKDQSILGPCCLFKKKLNHRYKNRSFFLTKNTARSPYNLNVYEYVIATLKRRLRLHLNLLIQAYDCSTFINT